MELPALCSIPDTLPPSPLAAGIGFSGRNGSALDLVITNTSEYTPNKSQRNGLSGSFGQVSGVAMTLVTVMVAMTLRVMLHVDSVKR